MAEPSRFVGRGLFCVAYSSARLCAWSRAVIIVPVMYSVSFVLSLRICVSVVGVLSLWLVIFLFVPCVCYLGWVLDLSFSEGLLLCFVLNCCLLGLRFGLRLANALRFWVVWLWIARAGYTLIQPNQ